MFLDPYLFLSISENSILPTSGATPDKVYISAQQLLDDSMQLALNVLDSGFAPDLLIGLWRGGTPVAIAMHEVLDYFGMATDHFSIKTSLYSDIAQRQRQVRIEGLELLLQKLQDGSRLLIIDDVFDTGKSVQHLLEEIKAGFNSHFSRLDIRVATPYFKPTNNLTDLSPDYYLHETSEWLVFPHELCGLSLDELLKSKPGIGPLRDRLLASSARP